MLATPLLWRREQAEFVAYVADRHRRAAAQAAFDVRSAREGDASPFAPSRIVEGVVGPGRRGRRRSACSGRRPARGHGLVLAWHGRRRASRTGAISVDGEQAVAIPGDDAARLALGLARGSRGRAQYHPCDAGPLRCADGQFRPRGRRQLQERLLSRARKSSRACSTSAASRSGCSRSTSDGAPPAPGSRDRSRRRAMSAPSSMPRPRRAAAASSLRS